ncbi:MAG: hypothetical protein LBK99_24755 [Opitutaceae bacterium]|jgi:hypothetical protein|nr:hypothetical protein [Opitutaceae bacterium]
MFALILLATAGAAHADASDVLFSDALTDPATLSDYRIVTLFAANAGRSSAKDSALIEQGDAGLALTDTRISGKGPVSLALLKAFPDDSGPFLVRVTLRPGQSTWAALKWGPQRNGNWPDNSHGIAISITPGGSWTVWANTNGKMKNVIAGGRATRRDEYPVALVFAGTSSARSVAVVIGDALVLPETPVTYPWGGHNLILQTLGNKTSGTAWIKNLSIEKLTPANNPVTLANQESAKSIGVWIEGEDTVDTNFHTGKVVSVGKTGPSGGMFLRLFTSKNNSGHPPAPYYAKYKINVPVADVYNLWIASTPNNAGWASPLTWRINGGDETALKGKAWSGASWGNASDKWAGWVFGWTQAGAVRLDAGEHEIEIGVTEPRSSGSHYVACLDALLLTNSKSFIPTGNHPRFSTQPAWEERMKSSSEREYTDALNHRLYYELIGKTREQVGEEVSAKILQKISLRPLPAAADRSTDATEFGLHGMERPFVSIAHNANTPEVARAYDLIARVGVDSLRTAESCLHRLTPNEKKSDTSQLNLRFDDLDFQVSNAWKYGMTHLFTVGYPQGPMTVSGNMLSACAPRYHDLYREYFDAVFSRYKDKGLRWIEMGNEVDAPSVWWKKSTAEQYVQEVKMVYESARKNAPAARVVAFGSTYSRDEKHGGEDGGRRFVARCFDLGIDKYADAYSLHHLSALKTKDFPAFFHREFARTGNPDTRKKPLLNTEQNSGSYPYDGAKAFARVFFLYDMPRMDFFIARDFYENGNLLAWGMFDIDWRPKLRMLTYAFSVDAMRGRELVGIAQPAPGVEAYVLKRIDTYKGRPATPGTDAPYSIVLWKTDRETRQLSTDATIEPVTINTGLKNVTAAYAWDLDPVTFTRTVPSFSVGDEPLAIYTEELPDWKLLTRDEYLATVEAGKTDAPLPTSNL